MYLIVHLRTYRIRALKSSIRWSLCTTRVVNWRKLKKYAASRWSVSDTSTSVRSEWVSETCWASDVLSTNEWNDHRNAPPPPRAAELLLRTQRRDAAHWLAVVQAHSRSLPFDDCVTTRTPPLICPATGKLAEVYCILQPAIGQWARCHKQW